VWVVFGAILGYVAGTVWVNFLSSRQVAPPPTIPSGHITPAHHNSNVTYSDTEPT
jgi:hypothetical protein